MNERRRKREDGIVYSTDPGFRPEEDREEQITVQPAQQKLKIRLETKHRAGKTVTIIEGFAGTNKDLQELGKQLRSFCGAGGSVSEGEIIIQGDHREKVNGWLIKNGFTNAKKI